MMTTHERLALRTSTDAITIHDLADQLDEVARRLHVLVKMNRASPSNEVTSERAYEKLIKKRRELYATLKRLGDEVDDVL